MFLTDVTERLIAVREAEAPLGEFQASGWATARNRPHARGGTLFRLANHREPQGVGSQEICSS